MKLKILNQYQLKGERNNRSRIPVVLDNKILVGFCYDKKGFVESKLQCLNKDDFNLIWEYTHPHVICNVVMFSSSQIIASFMNGTVISFNVDDGKILWLFTTENGNIGWLSNIINSKIIFSNIQADKSYTWCLNASDGAEIWKQPNSGHSYIPLIYNNRVYNCIQRNIYSLNLLDGLTIWENIEPETFLFNPTIIKDYIAVPGYGLINFYETASGKKINSININLKSAIRHLVQDNNAIFFGNEKGFFYAYALDNIASGNQLQELWKIDTNGSIQSIPAINNDYIFLINDAKKLFVINKHNGAIEIGLKIKSEAGVSGVVLQNNFLYLSCNGGNVYKYEIEKFK